MLSKSHFLTVVAAFSIWFIALSYSATATAQCWNFRNWGDGGMMYGHGIMLGMGGMGFIIGILIIILLILAIIWFYKQIKK